MPAGIAAKADNKAATKHINHELRCVRLLGAKRRNPRSHDMPASRSDEKFFANGSAVKVLPKTLGC